MKPVISRVSAILFLLLLASGRARAQQIQESMFDRVVRQVRDSGSALVRKIQTVGLSQSVVTNSKEEKGKAVVKKTDLGWEKAATSGKKKRRSKLDSIQGAPGQPISKGQGTETAKTAGKAGSGAGKVSGAWNVAGSAAGKETAKTAGKETGSGAGKANGAWNVAANAGKDTGSGAGKVNGAWNVAGSGAGEEKAKTAGKETGSGSGKGAVWTVPGSGAGKEKAKTAGKESTGWDVKSLAEEKGAKQGNGSPKGMKSMEKAIKAKHLAEKNTKAGGSAHKSEMMKVSSVPPKPE